MAGFSDSGYYAAYGESPYAGYIPAAVAGRRALVADPYYGVLPAPAVLAARPPVTPRYSTDPAYGGADPAIYIGPSPVGYYPEDPIPRPSGLPLNGPVPSRGPWIEPGGPAIIVGDTPSRLPGRLVTSREQVTSEGRYAPDDIMEYPIRKEKAVMWREVSIKKMAPAVQSQTSTAAYSGGPAQPTVPLPRGYQLAPTPQYGYYRDVMPQMSPYPLPARYALQPAYLPY